MRIAAIHPSSRRGFRGALRAFTLIELLLAIVLVLLLAGAMVFNFSNLDQGTALEEGAARLETLIRYAQATAANTGRRVQLAFPVDEGAVDAADFMGKVRVLWEPDPLGRPGEFELLWEAQTPAEGVNELVRIQEVGLPGATLGSGTNAAPAEPAEPKSAVSLDEAMSDFFMPIYFAPDGSSDSAEIVVVAVDSDQGRGRYAIVRLEGITSAVSHEVVIPPDDEELDSEPRQNTKSEKRSSTSKDTARDTVKAPRQPMGSPGPPPPPSPPPGVGSSTK